MPDIKTFKYKNKVITTEDGLIFADGTMVPVPLADNIARHFGFVYAERLVKHLEGLKK